MITEECPGGRSENIPLQCSAKSYNSCTEDCIGGSRFINIAFSTLTVVVTIALLVQIYYGDYQVVPHGSVATDSLDCSEIGTLILKQNGNAMDATIASAMCLAVVAQHRASLDGDGQLLIYDHRTRLMPSVIDFSHINESEHLPKMVLGLAYCHKLYGSLPWKKLVEPAAKIAKKGFVVSRTFIEAIRTSKKENIFGKLELGQLLNFPILGGTLDVIANIPEKELYSFIEGDPIQTEAEKFTFCDHEVFVPNIPSIGPFLLLLLQQIAKHNFTSSDALKPEYIYRLAEITQIVNKNFNIGIKFHQGTSSNIAVIDLHDHYVSFITGMYSSFGSGLMSSSGYLLDVKTRKVPCSRIPIIITDVNTVCGRRIVFGASNIAVASQLIAAMLIQNGNATESIEGPRFHTLVNGSIGIEGSHGPFFSKDVLLYLESLSSTPLLVPEPYDSSNVVEKVADNLNSHSDSRGGGISSRFK